MKNEDIETLIEKAKAEGKTGVELPGWLGFLDGSACAPIPDDTEGEVEWARIGADGCAAHTFQVALVRALNVEGKMAAEQAMADLVKLNLTMDDQTRAYIGGGWGGEVDVRGMGTGLLN